MIPGVLIAGAFFVHDQATQKQKKIAASSAKQEVLFSQPSPPPEQSSISQELPESEQINGDQVHIPPSPGAELSWLDGEIRGQLLKSLKRADLIHADGEIESFNSIQVDRGNDLLGAKFNKADPKLLGLEGMPRQNLLSKTDQDLPSGLLVANSTRVSLSGVDLFSNPLTSADLFEPKLLKSDLRGASFTNDGLMSSGFPGVSLLAPNSLATAHLNIDNIVLSKADLLNANSTSAFRSKNKLIKIAPLGSNLGKIDLIEAGFGAVAQKDNSVSNEENLPNQELSIKNSAATTSINQSR